MPIGEALRRSGLDELKYAQAMGGLIDTLTDKDGEEKLLLEGLKELGRHLESSRAAERPAGNAQVIVQLVHNVPRPGRPEALPVSQPALEPAPAAPAALDSAPAAAPSS
jgi:hypothetical protein